MPERVEYLIILCLGVFAAVPILILAFQRHGSREIDEFKRFIEIATLLVITFGLFFAWDQARKLTESINVSNRALNASLMSSIAQQTLDKNKIFIEKPDFLKYFYDGTNILESDDNYVKVRAIALAILDFMDHVAAIIYLPTQTDLRQIAPRQAGARRVRYERPAVRRSDCARNWCA